MFRNPQNSILLPRLIRFRDAPYYLGMDRTGLMQVRPCLTEIPIGKQGIGFDRLELDAWLDDYIARNGRPAQKGLQRWDANRYLASSNGPASGTKPYPFNWEEQTRLFRELPSHLEEMALFAVNTGCRDAEICGLRWDYEVAAPELKTSVFIVPGDGVKNGDDRLVVLNRVAASVVNERRGRHQTYVFTYNGRPIARMLNSAWKKARTRSGLEGARVHDLKHTFGRRLRAAGVSFEDPQDLLGHRSGKITTHYSAA